MATEVIGAYTAANSIDGANHYLLIQPGNSSTAYNKINRNVFLGVTGQPVDISTSQTLTNKVLGNTNTIAVLDSSFTIQDSGDATKQAQFQLSGLTTATTRTYTLPDASSTLMDISSVQTATNKTLTAPVITGGSVDNATITVDTISGHTTAGNGTAYGLSIHSGIIQTAGAGGTTLMQTNAVQANQFATNAITLGYAQITTNFTTTSTSVVQVTGLTSTVTIPAGGRKVKVTVFCASINNNTGTAAWTLSIWDGTVGSGTQITNIEANSGPSNSLPGVAIAVVTPSAGSKTYNVGLLTTNGSDAANITAGTTNPAFILVEAI